MINVHISPHIQFDNNDRIYVMLSNPEGAKLVRSYAEGRIVESLD